jgi:hypothetical protein
LGSLIQWRGRKSYHNLSSYLSVYLIQGIASIVLLAISAHTASATMPDISEWKACSRPLGLWVIVWIIRIASVCFMHVWTWQRAKLQRRLEAQAAATEAVGGQDLEIGAGNGNGNRSPHTNTTSTVDVLDPSVTTGTTTPRPTPTLPNSILYSRASLVVTFLSLTWWFTLQVFLYTSIYSCRLSSPHLWWLSFGLACIGYFYILEIIVVALALFFVGPLVVVSPYFNDLRPGLTQSLFSFLSTLSSYVSEDQSSCRHRASNPQWESYQKRRSTGYHSLSISRHLILRKRLISEQRMKRPITIRPLLRAHNHNRRV